MIKNVITFLKRFFFHKISKNIQKENRGGIHVFAGISSLTSNSTLRKKCPYLELFWSEGGKMWIRTTPNTDTFHAELNFVTS